jgi:hypothetical protein
VDSTVDAGRLIGQGKQGELTRGRFHGFSPHLNADRRVFTSLTVEVRVRAPITLPVKLTAIHA